MEIKTFTYTKNDGKQSTRTVLEIVKPCNFMEGIDMSELSEEEQGEFVANVSTAYEEFRAKMVNLQHEFDLRGNYRRFDVLKMTEVKTEWL